MKIFPVDYAPLSAMARSEELVVSKRSCRLETERHSSVLSVLCILGKSELLADKTDDDILPATGVSRLSCNGHDGDDDGILMRSKYPGALFLDYFVT